MTVHHVFANRSNAGDWLSAKGIQRSLGLPVREHLCDDPFVGDTLAALAVAEPDDLVVIGGGGLFMEYFTPFLEGLLALADHLDYCFWGVGFVDLKSERSRPDPDLLAALVTKSVGSWVRDDLTRDSLGPELVPDPVACPSILAVDERPVRERGILHAANLTTVGPDAYERMRATAQALAEATGRTYRETSNRFDDGEAGLDQTLRAYERSDLVLSSRLHGCVMAFAMGRPVLAVSGDRKIDSFMRAAGREEYLVDQHDLSDLAQRLAVLPEQVVPRTFVERERTANVRVAARVRALARTPHSDRRRLGSVVGPAS